MLRFAIKMLHLLTMLNSTFSDMMQHDHCPCLITHTCSHLSKCFIDSQRTKLADRLSTALIPKRSSACYNNCPGNLPSINDSPNETGHANASAIVEVPMNLSRLQKRHIRRYVMQPSRRPMNCVGSGCLTNGGTESARSVQLGPSYEARVEPRRGLTLGSGDRTEFADEASKRHTSAPNLITTTNTSSET